MMLAVEERHLDVVEGLAEYDYSLLYYVRPQRGSLLHAAGQDVLSLIESDPNQRLEVLRFLLSNNVDVLAKNIRGEIPLDQFERLASENHREIEHTMAYNLLWQATCKAPSAPSWQRLGSWIRVFCMR